jgi:hypothetical protein
MEPSFKALFRRGHYYRAAVKGKRERKEAERFAVSALAFCLRYDEAFTRGFLRNVCGFRSIDVTTPVQLRLRIEPARNSPDLFVAEPALSLYAVIEAKIWAKVKEHQDFRCTRSFGGPGGYGTAIAGARDIPKGAEIRYVLLDSRQKPEEKKVSIGGRLLRCRTARWEDLFRDKNKCSPFVNDLRDCLADFGISMLALEATKNMRIDRNVTVGAKAWKVISSICHGIGIQPDRFEQQEIDYEDDQNWWLGCNIEAPTRSDYRKGNHGKLQKLVGHKEMLAWLGYQAAEDGTVDVSVWFYCSNESRADSIRKKIRGSVAGGTKVNLVEDDNNLKTQVEVKTSLDQVGDKNGQTWYLSVFKPLGIECD